MKANIMEIAFEETLAYFKGLNVREHYASLLARYVSYHNKGIFVHFNFGTNKTRDYYGHYARRYSLSEDILDTLSIKAPRNLRMDLINAVNRNDKAKRSIGDELDKWKKLLRDFETEFEMLNGQNIVDPQFASAGQSLISVYKGKVSELKQKQDRAKLVSQNLSRMQKQFKQIFEEFNNADIQFLRQALKFFMKRLEQMVQSLFVGEQVRVIYSTKSIMERYLEKKKPNHTIEPYPDREMSLFERELLGFMETAKKMFSIVIQQGEKMYRVSSSESGNYFTASIEEGGTYGMSQDEQREAFDPLNQFLMKYRGFSLLLSGIGQVRSSMGEDNPTQQAIVDIIVKSYPEDIITKYNQMQAELIKKLQEEKAAKPRHIFGKQAIEQTAQTFPALSFDSGVKEDEHYNIMMKQFNLDDKKHYIEYIDSIASADLLLKLTA